MITFPNAKINLGLNIVEKAPGWIPQSGNHILSDKPARRSGSDAAGKQ